MILESAPAKINLTLSITGRRTDGYHLLQSLVVFVDACDSLEFSPSPEITMEIAGDFASHIPTDDSNIILKTAKLLRETYNVNLGAHIKLVKNLPTGAGIGGGSADAAATFRALSRLWNIPLSYEIAARLGADIPACIRSEPLLMRGIGDEITEISLNGEVFFLLVHPGKPLETAAVYKNFSGEFRQPQSLFSSGLLSDISPDDLIRAARSDSNDLLNPAIKLLPEIPQIISAIRSQKECLFAGMSGSGSTCFGIFANKEASENAGRFFKKSHPDYWVKPAQIYR